MQIIMIYAVPVVLAWLGYRQLAGGGSVERWAVKRVNTLLRMGLRTLWRDTSMPGGAGRLEHPPYRYRDPWVDRR